MESKCIVIGSIPLAPPVFVQHFFTSWIAYSLRVLAAFGTIKAASAFPVPSLFWKRIAKNIPFSPCLQVVMKASPLIKLWHSGLKNSFAIRKISSQKKTHPTKTPKNLCCISSGNKFSNSVELLLLLAVRLKGLQTKIADKTIHLKNVNFIQVSRVLYRNSKIPH